MREPPRPLSTLQVLRLTHLLGVGRVLTPFAVMLVLAVAMSAPGDVGGAGSTRAMLTNAARTTDRTGVTHDALHVQNERPVPQMFDLTPAINADDRRAMQDIASLAAAINDANWRAIEDIAHFAAALPPPPTPEPSPDDASDAPAPPLVQAPPVRSAAPPPPPPPPPAPAVQGLDTSPMNALERALFDDTNRRRASAGLPALQANPALVGIARIRSQDMARNNYFAHTSPTGQTAFSLMDQYGVGYAWAGENLAKNNYPASQCVAVADDALWNSPPHRENILGPHYTQMGVALAVDASGMNYFTIIFAG